MAENNDNPTTGEEVGSTSMDRQTTADASRPIPQPPVMSWPNWPHCEDAEEGKYLTIKTKLDSMRAGNELLLDDVAKLSNQISRLTEMVAHMAYGTKPSIVKSPKSSFSKSPLDDILNTKVDKAGVEDSSHKISVPSSAKFVRVEMEFGSKSAEQIPKEHGTKPTNNPLNKTSSTPLGQAPRDRPVEPSDKASPSTLSVMEPDDQSVESSSDKTSPSPEQARGEDAPEPSGKMSSPSPLLEESDDESSERSIEYESPAVRPQVAPEAQQLANHDVLFDYFMYYLKNPNRERHPVMERGDAAHTMAHSFQQSVRRPARMAHIARPEFDDIRETVHKLNDNTLVDLYVALSQRHHDEYEK